MNEKMCRLCLNTISGSDFQPVEDLKDILNELLLNLNLGISNKVLVCYTCAINVKILSNFKKSMCVNTEDKKLSFVDVKMDNLDSEEENTNTNSVEDQKMCHFCRKTLGIWDYTSLNGSKENIFLVDMLQKHIPDWNLNCTDNLLTCHSCLESLQNLLNFIMNCLDLEGKIKKYVELKGIDNKGHIDLNEVQKFTLEPVVKCEAGCSNVIKMEEGGDKCKGNLFIKIEAEIKSENEIDNTDLNIKTEELDIKLEESDSESSQESSDGSLDNSILNPQARNNQQDSEGITVYKCETCPYETKRTDYFRKHKLIHTWGLKRFKCKYCSYETKRAYHLKRHNLLHKNPSDITMFKCKLCPYEGLHASYLKRHSLTHKKSEKFKCHICSYDSTRRDYLMRHIVTHMSTPKTTVITSSQTITFSLETDPFKCELCPYAARYRGFLNRHKLKHVNISDVTLFKCDQCSYVALNEDYLERHKLTQHKSKVVKLTIFKCDLCPYETVQRNNFQRHQFIHKRSLNTKV